MKGQLEMDRVQMKKELIGLFSAWWGDGGDIYEPTYIAKETFSLMADAALAVLFAVEDAIKFAEKEL